MVLFSVDLVIVSVEAAENDVSNFISLSFSNFEGFINIFNKKPERGVHYLIGKGFLDNSPQAVARFLMTRKGLAKQMIGEYLGNISSPFNQSVLHAFASEMDLSNMPIDMALRKFQTYFRYCAA